MIFIILITHGVNVVYLARHIKNKMLLIVLLMIPLIINKLNNKIMQQGTVKFFNETKGFGFITPSNGGSEIFVHSSGLIDNIRENDTVSYEVEQGRKGLNAVNVKVS